MLASQNDRSSGPVLSSVTRDIIKSPSFGHHAQDGFGLTAGKAIIRGWVDQGEIAGHRYRAQELKDITTKARACSTKGRTLEAFRGGVEEANELLLALGADQAIRAHIITGKHLWIEIVEELFTTRDNADRAVRTDPSTIAYRRADLIPSDHLTKIGQVRYGGRWPNHRLTHSPTFLIFLLMLALTTIAVCLGLLPLFAVFSGQAFPLSTNVSVTICASAVGIALFWITRRERFHAARLVHPIYSAGRHCLLHFRDADVPRSRQFAIASFEADCPVCRSPVRLSDDYPGHGCRIVGECYANPDNHVFSFDHTLLSGRMIGV